MLWRASNFRPKVETEAVEPVILPITWQRWSSAWKNVSLTVNLRIAAAPVEVSSTSAELIRAREFTSRIQSPTPEK